MALISLKKEAVVSFKCDDVTSDVLVSASWAFVRKNLNCIICKMHAGDSFPASAFLNALLFSSLIV